MRIEQACHGAVAGSRAGSCQPSRLNEVNDV